MSAIEVTPTPAIPVGEAARHGGVRAPVEGASSSLYAGTDALDAGPDALGAARDSSRRLAELLGREHEGLADFLVALSEFDRQARWRELGHRDLFAYLHHELNLSNSAAHYRKVAAGLIQRFPEVVPPLRDGRLCLSAVGDLARVITRENWESVLPRFYYRGRRQAREASVEIRPAEVIPRRDVVTAVQGPAAGTAAETATAAVMAAMAMTDAGVSGSPVPDASRLAPGETGKTHLPEGGMGDSSPSVTTQAADAPVGSNLDTVTEPLTAELYRLHVTLTKRVIRKLEKARDGLSRAIPRAGFADAIDAALDLLLEQHARRRGFTGRPQANPRPSSPLHIPAAVRRAVWERDEGRCRWPLDSGGHCGSTWQVEVDHVVPRGLGGPSTIENCRLLCRSHNDLSARLVYGNDWMDQFTAGT